MRPTPVMPAPSHNGGCQPDSYSGRAQVGEVSTARSRPARGSGYSEVASAMPLRGNHCARPAIREMKIAPSLMPKMNRPAPISSYGVADRRQDRAR